MKKALITIIALVVLVSVSLNIMHGCAVAEFGEDTRIGHIELAEWSASDHIVIMSPFCDGEDVYLLVWDAEDGRVYSDGFYGFWNEY